MKKLSFGAVMLTAMITVTVFFTSCGSKVQTYQRTIPEKTPIVLEIDMQSLTLKSNILSYKETIADMLNANAEQSKLIEKFADELRNADDGGMNFNYPVYLYTTQKMDGLFMTAAVRNKAKVKDLLLSVDENITVIEDEATGIAWIKNKRQRIGAISDEVLILGETKESYLLEQMMQCDGTFFDTKMGDAMSSYAGDFTLMVDATVMDQEQLMGTIYPLTYKIDPSIAYAVLEQVSEMQIVANWKFLVGRIELNIHDVSDSDRENIFQKISPDIFENIPARGMMGMLAVGIDTDALTEEMEKELDNDESMLGNDMRAGMEIFKGILTDCGSTAAVALYENPWSDTPDVTAWLPIGKRKLQTLMLLMGSNELSKMNLTGDDEYSALSTITNYNCGPVNNTMEQASEAAKCYLYGYLNVNQLMRSYLADERMNVSAEKRQMFETMEEVAELFDYAEVRMEQTNKVSFILYLKNSTRNSLDLLIKGLFQYGAQYYQYMENHGLDFGPRPYGGDDDDYDYGFGDDDWDADEVGGYDPTYEMTDEDWETLYRMLLEGMDDEVAGEPVEEYEW